VSPVWQQCARSRDQPQQENRGCGLQAAGCRKKRRGPTPRL